jgi:biopolymer transport protein ExbD
MRRPSTFTDRRTPIDLQLTPMIDCVFLLMVYFIWSSSFTIAEQSLPSQLSPLPSGSGTSAEKVPDPIEDFEPLVIRLTNAGGRVAWTLRDVPMESLTQLQGALATAARIKRDAPVILHPDADVPLGDVIDVYDLARLAGFEKVQFAASEG